MGGMIAVVILALLMVPVFFVSVQRFFAGDQGAEGREVGGSCAASINCRHPRRRVTQHSREVGYERTGRGVLDHPPSRTMTVGQRPSLPQRLQNLHQFGVDEFIAADHVAGLERVVVAVDAD